MTTTKTKHGLDDFTRKHLKEWCRDNFPITEGEYVYDAIIENLEKMDSNDLEYWLNRGWFAVCEITPIIKN